MKKEKYCFLALILLIVMIPVIFFNNKKNQYSYIDNRMLAELNEYTPASIDNYINDRIGLRKPMIFAFNKLNKSLFNYSTNPKYIYSDDGSEIYNKVELEDTSKNYYQSFSDAVIKINSYLDKKNIPFFYVVTPSKASIYSEKLPGYFHYSDENIKEYINTLKNNDVKCIDLFEILKKESNNNRVFNKQYDVFHWNDYGLFIGTNAILKEIHNYYPNVRENVLDDFNIDTIKGSDLSKNEYYIDEDVTFFKLKNQYIDCSKDYIDKLDLYDDFQEFYYLKTSNDDNPKILMFGGSYFISENRYEQICNQASELIMIHNYNNVFNIKKYVEMFDPDFVIFDSCEYTFKEYYFSEYYMNTMDLD